MAASYILPLAMNPYEQERIDLWVADFLESPRAAAFAAGTREFAAPALAAFHRSACAVAGHGADELEEPDLKEGLTAGPARLQLPESVRRDVPELCAAYLEELQAQGRLGGGAALAGYVRALAPVYERAATGKTETIKRPGARIGRNDPCPCGSGKKYKKCCLGR